MGKEVILIIANSYQSYMRWLACNYLLGERKHFKYIKDEQDLQGYCNNRIVCIGNPIHNTAYNSLRHKYINSIREAGK